MRGGHYDRRENFSGPGMYQPPPIAPNSGQAQVFLSSGGQPASVSLEQLLPQLIAVVQQQQQGGGASLAPIQPIPPPVLGKNNFGAEQAQLGVRVAEFHALSVMAPYVRPAAAIKLQTLWDRGNRYGTTIGSDDLGSG